MAKKRQPQTVVNSEKKKKQYPYRGYGSFECQDIVSFFFRIYAKIIFLQFASKNKLRSLQKCG